jgi:hypothetical protein
MVVLFLLIVVLFGFLNIKSVKIYAILFIFSTTLLLYKLDTLLLKQKNFPVLDITGFFFRIRIQVTALVLRTSAFTWVLMRKKKPVISNTGKFFCFNSTVSYTFLKTKKINKSNMYFKRFLATNNKYISVIAHSKHIESTSGHTGNISGRSPSPLHNTKLTFDTLLWK